MVYRWITENIEPIMNFRRKAVRKRSPLRLAQQSYLLVTEDDFDKRAGRRGGGGVEIFKEKTPRFLNNLAWTLQLCTVQSNS